MDLRRPCCAPLASSFLRPPADADFLTQTQARLAFTDHALAEHPDEIPPYVDGCANCQEWALHDLTGHSVRDQVIAREALAHRAGHVLQPSLRF